MRDGGVRLQDIAGDEDVAVAAKGQTTNGPVALAPEVGVEGEQAVAVVDDGGVVRAAAADQVVETGERGAETVTAVEEEIGVNPVSVQVAELEIAADGGAVEGMVDEEGAVGVVADEDVFLGEAVQQVATDFQTPPVEVDRQTTGVQAERSGGGDADGAVVDTYAGRHRVLVVLQPERRAVDHPDFGDTVLRVVVIIDPAGDDGVTATVEGQAVAGTEVHVTREGGGTEHGSEAGLAPASAAEADGTGESIVADGDDRAGGVVGARAATRRGDDAVESQPGDGVRRPHDERAAGETRITRLRHAGDGDRTDA